MTYYAITSPRTPGPATRSARPVVAYLGTPHVTKKVAVAGAAKVPLSGQLWPRRV